MTKIDALESVFDHVIAEEAFELARPTILELIRTRVAKRKDLHVLVARRVSAEEFLDYGSRSFGDKKKWMFAYKDIAESKRDITVRTGLPSREAQLLHSELLCTHDTKYWGSWIEGNIVVAVSGADAWVDEMIAKIVVAIIKGLIQARIERNKAEFPASDFYQP